MSLSESQLNRVQRMTRDEWESEDELWQFFETVTDTEELHLYADGFNWDTGVEELRRVIRHPLCDRGTAFLFTGVVVPAGMHSISTEPRLGTEMRRTATTFRRRLSG